MSDQTTVLASDAKGVASRQRQTNMKAWRAEHGRVMQENAAKKAERMQKQKGGKQDKVRPPMPRQKSGKAVTKEGKKGKAEGERVILRPRSKGKQRREDALGVPPDARMRTRTRQRTWWEDESSDPCEPYVPKPGPKASEIA